MQKALFKEFLDSEKTCGLVLLVCVVVSLVLSNSIVGCYYQAFWQMEVDGVSLVHIINDGLMTLFFLLIGLELEREIYVGELRRFRNAILPIIAALGGMLVPSVCYYFFTSFTPFTSGIGIPMATDIAFAVGILSLFGKRVPAVLKIFLVALTIIDDLGSIVVIAIFYAGDINFVALGLSFMVFVALLVLNRTNVLNLVPYIIGGIVMWILMYKSGVHPTLTGVLLAFAIPFRDYQTDSPSFRLQHYLTKPVGLLVLPIFALANTAITVGSDSLEAVLSPYGLGIFFGLFLGKPLGIILFSYLAIRFGICTKSKTLEWKYILGVGLLAGIGFTMSIFITMLSFSDAFVVSSAKVAILLASLVSGVVGYWWLYGVLPVGKTDMGK